MRRITGLAIMVACAVSAIAVSNASASHFSSTAAGALTVKKPQTQLFTTNEGNVECTVVKLTKGTAALLSLVQHATIQYEKCKAFGLTATITPALYLFSADNGQVSVENTITITTLTCVVNVGSTSNKSLKTVVYKNSGSLIVLEPSVKSITYEAETGCPSPGTFSNGTYSGTSEIGLASGTGTLKWVQQ